MRSGSLFLPISQSAALYSCLQYLLSGGLEIPVFILRLLVFACRRNVVVSGPRNFEVTSRRTKRGSWTQPPRPTQIISGRHSGGFVNGRANHIRDAHFGGSV